MILIVTVELRKGCRLPVWRPPLGREASWQTEHQQIYLQWASAMGIALFWSKPKQVPPLSRSFRLRNRVFGNWCRHTLANEPGRNRWCASESWCWEFHWCCWELFHPQGGHRHHHVQGCHPLELHPLLCLRHLTTFLYAQVPYHHVSKSATMDTVEQLYIVQGQLCKQFGMQPSSRRGTICAPGYADWSWYFRGQHAHGSSQRYHWWVKIPWRRWIWAG